MARAGIRASSATFLFIVAALTTSAIAAPQSPAAPTAANPDKPMTDPTIGKKGPDCLDLHMIDHTEVLDDSTILFHMKGKKTYISKLPYRCHGLKFEEGFSYSTSINKICGNVDTIKVLRRGNSCALGPFHEYIAPPKAKKSDGGKTE